MKIKDNKPLASIFSKLFAFPFLLLNLSFNAYLFMGVKLAQS